MKMNIQSVMAAALAVTFVSPMLANSTSATEHFVVATVKSFSVPKFDPMVAVPPPVQPLRTASLMTLPGQSIKWRRGHYSTQELLDLSLKALRRGKADVPPVFLSRFPANLADLRDAKERKEIFIKTILPLVLRANDEIRSARQRVLLLSERARRQSVLTANDRAFLNRLAAQYGAPEGDLDELRRRVDVVPASLALAQGAEESGWGTSRFARVGNAVFGQRTFRKGEGLVPLKRSPGQSYEVKAFNNLYTSVRSYVMNLNTHSAYGKFRAKRAAYRGTGQPLNGYALMGTLNSYSERGQKYIDTIRVIMRANSLRDFDDVQLLPVVGKKTPS